MILLTLSLQVAAMLCSGHKFATVTSIATGPIVVPPPDR